MVQRCVAVAVLSVLALEPADAAAQPPRISVAGVFGIHNEDADHVTGSSPAAGLGVGIRLASSWHLEVEVSRPTGTGNVVAPGPRPLACRLRRLVLRATRSSGWACSSASRESARSRPTSSWGGLPATRAPARATEGHHGRVQPLRSRPVHDGDPAPADSLR